MTEERRPIRPGRLAGRTGEQPARPPAASVWLRHVALALLAALLAGALVFLAARGVGSAVLFVQQQELLGAVAGTLGGGIEGLANNDLRAARRELERLDERYWRLSLVAGAAAAALAAAATYLRLEGNANGT